MHLYNKPTNLFLFRFFSSSCCYFLLLLYCVPGPRTVSEAVVAEVVVMMIRWHVYFFPLSLSTFYY